MLKIPWKNKISNERVLLTGKTKREIIRIVKVRKMSYFGHIVRQDSLQKVLLEGKVNGKRSRGRHRINWGVNINNWMGMSYVVYKITGRDRQMWRQLVACIVEHDELTR